MMSFPACSGHWHLGLTRVIVALQPRQPHGGRRQDRGQGEKGDRRVFSMIARGF